MSVTRNIQRQAEQRLRKNGTIARVVERARVLNAEARALGYANAQEAYNKLGKAFIDSVKRNQP